MYSSCFLQVVLLYRVYSWDWFSKVLLLGIIRIGRRTKRPKNKHDLLKPKDKAFLIYGDDSGGSLISDRWEEAQSVPFYHFTSLASQESN